MSDRNRVKFYNKDDLSCGYSLQEAELAFQTWNRYIHSSDINDIIELYNIKLLFDEDIKLEKWSDVQTDDYREKCRSVPKVVGTFMGNITDANIETLMVATDFQYLDNLWQLISTYKVYKRISPEIFSKLLDLNDHTVWKVMRFKELVTYYGEQIANHLSKNQSTAEFLILQYLAEQSQRSQSLHFPSEFTQEMRNQVLEDYVEREDANINYLALLEESQNSKEFPLSDKLKLKARKKKVELTKKLFSNNPAHTGISYSIDIEFSSIPDGLIMQKFDEKEGIISYTYSREWIEENRDFPTLLNNFIYLFNYVDSCFRCTFVSYQSEMGVLEKDIGLHGKNDYQCGFAFTMKRNLSLLQMAAYTTELLRIGIRLEDVFKWFFEDYLKNELGAIGFTFNPPSDGTTYAEKCKLLSIAMDGVLKQYRCFCEDGYVNRELLEMSSGHIVFDQLMGKISRKYVYVSSDDIRREMNCLYSDQSLMSYTKKTTDRYDTLSKMLLSEEMRRDDFEKYQLGILDWLISRSVVIVSPNGILSLNKPRAVILHQLYDYEVICPRYCDDLIREQIDGLIASGELCCEETLFSHSENHYLNYVLNKAEYSNGLDLRNRYDHDTNSLDEKVQKQDYWELLKIMVLIIIKINEELTYKE